MSVSLRTRSAFTLVELLVVIAIIGMLVALLLPAVQAARESARRTQCTNNLKQIGLALQTYHDSIGQYPVGRDRSDQFGIAWTFRVLPFMEQENIHDSLDPNVQVDHQNNSAAMRTPVDTFFCPSRRGPAADRNFDNNDAPTEVPAAAAGGDYAGNAGLHYRYGTPDQPPITDANGDELELEEAAGPMFFGSDIEARHIADGTSQTFAGGERHIPVGVESDPGLEHHDIGDTAFFAGDHPGTIFGGTKDGLPESPEDPAEDKFGSEHAQLIQFVFLDGHVASISTNIELTTLQRLSTFGDGWPITEQF